MRRSRRNGHAGLEFGGSGEDSFVAVVVTKLTGALLFILLLTMVIMALLPKAIDLPRPESEGVKSESAPLEIATPEMLPEAIAGHPYTLALAAAGGKGERHWSVDGKLPEGLVFDASSAQLKGTPLSGTASPVELVLRVSDDVDRTSRVSRLVVYQSDKPLSTPSKWDVVLPPVSWRSWFEHGFGFLVLWLIHLVGMNSINGLERWSLEGLAEDADADVGGVRARFASYRWLIRLATLAAAGFLGYWLWSHRS